MHKNSLTIYAHTYITQWIPHYIIQADVTSTDYYCYLYQTRILILGNNITTIVLLKTNNAYTIISIAWHCINLPVETLNSHNSQWNV